VRIVSIDDVPIAGGLMLGGEPEQLERNMAIEATVVAKHEFVEIRVNVFGYRGKSRGIGMIIRFSRRRESDSVWACRRLRILTV
jgi:hypothetical protein